ncbi:AraC family transcriptional regulator ligand-binding domain-containing protein [Chitinivorax sp. B]|uniref:AraC family transcriptional regulator ligand-binding domain-containing protein n=1 Tax=Chitinivorax sp. B TaxID=2502235 RepID=UPI0010F766A9|nr:AraC family transcriptional regulator ligand-binding domain-containing protein [Chitinivorax sp. B]
MPTTPTITVAISWIHSIVDAAAVHGMTLEQLCQAANLPLALFQQSPGRLPIDQVVGKWQAAATLSHDPLFGLHMGEQIKPASFIIVAFTLLSTATLRDTIRHMQRYQRLISDAAHLQLMESDPCNWLVYHLSGNNSCLT